MSRAVDVRRYAPNAAQRVSHVCPLHAFHRPAKQFKLWASVKGIESSAKVALYLYGGEESISRVTEHMVRPLAQIMPISSTFAAQFQKQLGKQHPTWWTHHKAINQVSRIFIRYGWLSDSKKCPPLIPPRPHPAFLRQISIRLQISFFRFQVLRFNFGIQNEQSIRAVYLKVSAVLSIPMRATRATPRAHSARVYG